MFKKPKRKVEKVFLHCSASDNESLYGARLRNEIDSWHKARRFDEIGYHFVIDKLGRILIGRDVEKIPAAQKGYNTGSIAICVHGLEEFTGESMETLIMLCNEINKAYKGAVTFHGHCEVSDRECPVFPYKTVLQLDEDGFMENE